MKRGRSFVFWMSIYLKKKYSCFNRSRSYFASIWCQRLRGMREGRRRMKDEGRTERRGGRAGRGFKDEGRRDKKKRVEEEEEEGTDYVSEHYSEYWYLHFSIIYYSFLGIWTFTWISRISPSPRLHIHIPTCLTSPHIPIPSQSPNARIEP